MLLIDMSKVVCLNDYRLHCDLENSDGFEQLYKEALDYILFYEWIGEIKQCFVGLSCPPIIGVFLFQFAPTRIDVDNWVWVVVGDIPPAYITLDNAPNPACALDGYISAMDEWVKAAENGSSVASLIPVNVPATKEYGENLRIRLRFIDDKILSNYKEDLI